MTFKARLARAVADTGPIAASLVDERRWAQRKGRALPCLLVSDQLPASVRCLVRDMSSTGAKVELVLDKGALIQGAEALPKTLTLFFLRDQVQVRCAVQWSEGKLFGVKFMGSMQEAARRAATAPAKKTR